MTEPIPMRIKADNLEMAREILERYQQGDDRPLTIGWATRLASHLLACSSEEDKWLLIKEAPTDDPNFQAWACHPDGKDGWCYYIINRHDIGGRYECWVVPPGRPVAPTHFRPLPAPPQVRSNQ